MKHLSRLKRRKSLLFILLTQAVSAISTLATFSLIGHVLGQQQLGLYALGLAVASPLFIVLGLSARTVYVTFPSEVAPHRAILVGVLCSTCAGFVTWIVGWGFGIPAIAALVAGVKALDHLTGVCQGLLQRRGFIFKAYWGQLMNGTLTVVAVAAALTIVESLTFALALSIVASLLVFCMASFLVKTSPGVGARALGWDIPQLLRAGVPLSVGGGAIALSAAIPAYAVAAFSGPASVAVFSVLSSVRTAANIFFSAVAQSDLHELSRSSREQRMPEFEARLRAAFRLVLFVSVFFVALLLALGPWAITVGFNVEVDGMRSMLAVVSLGIAAAGLTYVADAALSSLQAYASQLRAALIVLVIVAIASITLVPVADVLGALGALVLGLTASAVVKSVQLKRYLKHAGGSRS